MSEVRRCHLGLDDGFWQQASSSKNVFIEELDDNVLNVGDVDLVDDTVDTFSEQFPHHFLVLHSPDVFL